MNEDAQPAADLLAQSATGHADEDSSVERKKPMIGADRNTYRPEMVVDDPRMGGES